MEIWVTDEEIISIQDISTDSSFSAFTVVIDREAYENSFDGFSGDGLRDMLQQVRFLVRLTTQKY